MVCREIARNKDQRSGEYKHDLAHKKYLNRKRSIPKFRRLTEDVKESVKSLLIKDYSPEQVVGALRKDGKPCVSHERIYQYIWSNKKQNGTLDTHLRRQGRNHKKRGNNKDPSGLIKDRVNIAQRPPVVNFKRRFGELIIDLIIGENHNQAIVTINDRASGVLKMKRVISKQASIASIAIVELLQEWIPYIHTITSDNGKEFAANKIVSESLNIDYYFANPYHSWERGDNENSNGLIRQYTPNKQNLTPLIDQFIKDIETEINNRPRKRFNYEIPIFMMEKLLFN